jgi:hypothetical protein
LPKDMRESFHTKYRSPTRRIVPRLAARSRRLFQRPAKPPVSVYLNPTDFNPDDEPIDAKSDKPVRLFELRRYNDGEARVPGTVNRFKTWEAELFRKSGIETLGFLDHGRQHRLRLSPGTQGPPNSRSQLAGFLYGIPRSRKQSDPASWQ